MELKQKLPVPIEQYWFPGAIALILGAIYTPLIVHWYDGWINKSISIEHEYFSHGVIGLPFAAYIVWTNRHQWHKLPNNAHPLGAFFLALGGVLYLSGLPELVNLSFPAILTGVCLWLKGIEGFRLQAFPLLLVFLATPTEIPYLIEPYILPLQSFIATIAGFILHVLGMDVTVEQIYLFSGERIVEVAPHCAGLKMLFTSLYVALMLLYWTGALVERTKTVALLIGTVAISVIANIIRNALLTFLHGTGRESLFHWMHEGWGGDLYSAGMLGLVVLLLMWIEKNFSEIPDETALASANDEQQAND